MCLPLLNLLNFELPSANKCRYVLTSPRSLKACRRAGIKPVDLLYKSLSELENETGNKKEAKILFEAYEMERQRKLTLCRALRNELLLNGQWGISEPSYKSEKLKRYSQKEHNLPAITGNYIMRRAETPENMRRPKDQLPTPRSYMNLPKVDVTLENNTLDKLTKNENDQGLSMISKQERPKEFEEKYIRETNNDSKDQKLMKDLGQTDLTEEGPKKVVTIADLDLVPNIQLEDREIKNNLQVTNVSLENIMNYEKLIKQEKNKTSQDMNNNHIKIKTKRPNSVSRKKYKDSKKHLKETDFKKALQHMKIQYSDPEYCTYKYKQVIENSVERDLRELEVQRVQRELEIGMEKWQDRVLLLQWLDVARAREQSMRELEMKVTRLQHKNRAKNIVHTMNINKVKEAEDMKAEGLRRQVEEKDRKILNLHQEKERIIYESKTRALSLQELKDHIRSIMTPETFDKKVAKLSMHRKVLNTQMCPRMMQRSHVWLG